MEQPVYTQLLFILDRIRVLARQHPDWRQDPVFAAAIAGDMRAVAAGGEAGLLKLSGAAQAGNTPEEFQATVTEWLGTARDRRWGRAYPQLVFQPMLELLAYLRAQDFTNFIVSGGGVEFVRAFAEAAYGVPPHQVVGSSFALRPGERDGRVLLTREPRGRFHRRWAGQAGRDRAAYRPPADRRLRQFGRRRPDAAIRHRRARPPARPAGASRRRGA